MQVTSRQPRQAAALVRLALCFSFALLIRVGTVSAQGCPAISPFDNVPDDAGIQCLLDLGGTVALQPGGQGYVIAAGLRIGVDGVNLTSAVPGQYAKLVADPSLRGMMLRMRNDVARNNYSLSYLIIDGNKFGRYGNYPLDCNDPLYRERGIGISIKGTGFSVHDVSFDSTLCGSALEVSGSGFNIYNNTINASGLPAGTVPGTQHPYADGITLLQCVNSNVTNNRVYDATDVGIVVGLGTTQGCNVSRNTVTNYNAYVFAGISTGGSTPHTNSYVSDNTVEAGLNLMSFGVWVGEGPWGAGMSPDVGLVSGNMVTGAVVNLGIDNIGAGTIRDNVLYGARGNRGMNGCQWPAELTVGAVGAASVQPGGVYRSWNPPSCTPYLNAPPSARVTAPADGSAFTTSQSVTITVDGSDPDTTVARVDFYAGSTFLGSDATAPFSWTVNAPLPTGTFDLTAIAFDASGRGPTSNVRRITVNQAPTVTMTSPANGAVIPAGSMVTLSASTTGAISYVDFYAFINQAWVFLGRDTTAPFAITVGPVQYGDYPLGALANGSIQSQIITVFVR